MSRTVRVAGGRAMEPLNITFVIGRHVRLMDCIRAHEPHCWRRWSLFERQGAVPRLYFLVQ